MQLHESPYHLSQPVAVERYGFALSYAEECEVLTAHGYRLIRGRKHVKRAVQIHRGSMYHSNAGELYEESKITNHPYALRPTCGLTRHGAEVDRYEEKRAQSCVADDATLAALNAQAEAWKSAAYGAWA